MVSCSDNIFNLGLCLTLVNSITLEAHTLFYRMLLTGSYNDDFTAWAQATGGNIWLEVYCFTSLQWNLDRYIEQLHFKASRN